MNDDFNSREHNEDVPGNSGYDPERDGYYPDSVSDAGSFRPKNSSEDDSSFQFHTGKTDRGNPVAFIGAALGIASLALAAVGTLLLLFIPIGSMFCQASAAIAIAGFIVSSLGVSYSRKRNGAGLAVGLGGSVLSVLGFLLSGAVLFLGSCLGCVFF